MELCNRSSDLCAGELDEIKVCQSDFNAASHYFISIECDALIFGQRLSNLYDNLITHYSRHNPIYPLKMTVLVESNEVASLVQQQVAEQSWLPAGTVELVAQKPLSGKQVSAQLWLIGGGDTQSVNVEPNIIQTPDVTWGYLAENYLDTTPNCAGIRFTEAWEKVVPALAGESLAVEDIIRTWLFVGNITEDFSEEENYQRLNEARRVAFVKEKFNREKFSYPASTGIGQFEWNFTFGALACKTTSDIQIVSLENSNQLSAFNYPINESKVAPLFSRACALISAHEAFVFVSGTASIIDSKSVHLGDPKQQVDQILDNIEHLLTDALSQQVSQKQFTQSGLDSIKSCWVYIKRAEDAAIIQKICQQKLPHDTVITYSIADVCRSELLVEIEAISIASLR